MSLIRIVNNSYRVLGVFSNAATKVIEYNTALLQANKAISNPYDFNILLPEVDRSSKNINKAVGKLSLSKEKLSQSLFWFINTGKDDQECISLLSEGKMEEAICQWEQTKTASSLHNNMVCYLIKKEYRRAISLAYEIFSAHIEDWRELFPFVLDISTEDITHTFLDCIYDEIPLELTSMNWVGLPTEWESYIKKKTVTPIIISLNSLIETFKAFDNDHTKGRLNHAFILLDQAQPLLSQMGMLLPEDSLLLQSFEDKVYTEILNCSITCYNEAFNQLFFHGNDELFREVAPACNELFNCIDLQRLPENTRKRVEYNKAIINERCEDLEKTIETSIAHSENVCWFCGSPEASLDLVKRYPYRTEDYNFKKTVTIHLCEKCQHERKVRLLWKPITGLALFTLLTLFLRYFTSFWREMESTIMIVSILLTFGICMGIGTFLSLPVRKLFNKRGIRHFKREIDDHPMIKMAKKAGYD